MKNSRNTIVIQNGVSQLFVDDAIVGSKEGIVRTLHPCSKLDEPVIVPDRPWEGDRIYSYATVYFDSDTKRFRMWYLTRLGRGNEHRAPGMRAPQGDMILYATSVDGIHWEKPNLGLHEFDGSKDNNILIFDKHGPTVIIDEEAEPDHRFKMAAWNWTGDKFGYWLAHSADGLDWHEYPINPVFMDSDEVLETITLARDPRTGEYFAFHRRWGTEGFKRRVIAVTTSHDFLAWSSPEVILVPDERDDVWTQDADQRTEFYGMSGFYYGGQFLGLLPVFNIIKDARSERRVGAEQSP